MKIRSNRKFLSATIATIAVAGLGAGVIACSDSGEREVTDTKAAVVNSTSSDKDGETGDSAATTRETLTGLSNSTSVSAGEDSSAVVDTNMETNADTNVESSAIDAPVTDTPANDTPATDVPASDTPASDAPSDTPASDTPVDTPTETPASDTPVEIPSDSGAPSVGSGSPTLHIPMNPGATVEMIMFVGSEGDMDASLFLKESGFGGNDIVSVKLVYYVGDTKTTTGATFSREASTIRSIWKAENMQLRTGDTVSVRITNSTGVTTYTDVTVSMIGPM